MASKIILGGVTLSTLRDWLNENKKKNTESGKDFTITMRRRTVLEVGYPSIWEGTESKEYRKRTPELKFIIY